MSDHFNKSDLHHTGDDAWKSQAPWTQAMMRGAHVGEVVPIRVDRNGGMRMLSKRGRPGASGSTLNLSKESYLLHTDVVLGVGGIHHLGSQLDFEDAFNLQNEPPAPNTPPIYRNAHHNQIGTCVLLNDVGKMMFNNNAATEAEALKTGCASIAKAFDAFMKLLQKSAADATRFRTHVFGTFGPEDAFSAAFDFNVKTQPYVYGQPLEEALNACFERFATVAPTFANAHQVEFTLRFIHETASGNEEVLIARSKDWLSGRLEDLTPWKLQRVEVPEETPLRLVGFRLELQRRTTDQYEEEED